MNPFETDSDDAGLACRLTGAVEFVDLPGYAGWAVEHDCWLAGQVRAIEQEARAWPPRDAAPLLSVCLGDSSRWPQQAVARTLDVLTDQSFGAWEVFVGASSATARPSACIRPVADELDGIDQCRDVLKRARGRYLLVLPPGTLPSAHLPWLLVVAAMGDPAVIYTDSDRLDTTGERRAPRLRTGWDPELLLAGDALGSVYAVRTDLARRVGGYRPCRTLKAALLDLLFRVTAVCPPSSIRHVPGVLWHSTGSDDARPPDDEAVRAVVVDALRERGLQATVEPAPLLPRALLVHWSLPAMAPMVSIIVPMRDRADLLARCVDGILNRTDYAPVELLIVDNGSVEPDTLRLLADLAEDPRVRVLSAPGPFNFSALNNRAIAQATGEVVVFLNNDTDVIGQGWLGELVGQALRPEIGAAGAKLLYPDGRVQHCGVWTGPNVVDHQFRFAGRHDPGPLGELATCRSVLAVTGACLAMRRDVFLEVGGFDEARFKVAFNDVDLCLRLGDFGYRVVCTPAAELFHLESTTRGLDDTPEKSALAHAEFSHLRELWKTLLDGDPFYNPHLAFVWDGVALRRPDSEAPHATWMNDFSSPVFGCPRDLPFEASRLAMARAVGRMRQSRQQAYCYVRETEELHVKLAVQQAQLAALHSTAIKLERDVITLTEERAKLEGAFQQVVQSTAWKASWPLRRLGAALPPRLRMQVAKVTGGFWTRLFGVGKR